MNDYNSQKFVLTDRRGYPVNYTFPYDIHKPIGERSEMEITAIMRELEHLKFNYNATLCIDGITVHSMQIPPMEYKESKNKKCLLLN